MPTIAGHCVVLNLSDAFLRQAEERIVDPEPLYQPSDLLHFVDLCGGALVPGSDAVVYVANTIDGEAACKETALWLSDGGKHRRLAPADAAQFRPTVSPDGTQVAFLQVQNDSDDDQATQLCVYPLAGGETTVLTSFPRGTGPAGPAWSPDGQFLAVDASGAPCRDPDLAYRVTRTIWRMDNMGLVDDKATDVFVVPAAGGPPHRLTDEGGVISFLEWSPDGKEILFGTFGAADSTTYEIKIVEHPGGNTRTVTSAPFLAYTAVAAWLPDGRVAYNSPGQINQRIDLIVFDPASGTHESRLPDSDGQMFGLVVGGFDSRAMEPRIVVDPSGESAYVYIQKGGSMLTTRVTLRGDIRAEWLTEPSYSAVPLAVDGNRLLVIRTAHTEPANLVVIDTQTGAAEAVTELNAGWLTEMPFDVHHLTYPTSDGETEIEGWYLAPRQSEAPYPTVLHIHGGPFAAHGEIFNLDNLLLTAAGYGVLSVDFRSGSGYGDAHARMLIGDWGRFDMADLLQGVDVAVDAGLADGDRVASFGLSGGGYLTSWLLTHSDRFRAGVAECLVSDWTGMLGSDIPHVIATWMDSQAGHGEASMAPYIRMAPSTYAAQCSAPLMILEHEADLRCPISQGDILYNELKLAGKETEMLRLPGVPHDPFAADLRVRVARAEALIEWMDRYLKGAVGA
jgi:dipeptidyl aminopeptidase/acylaminoacyl peptidase